MIGFHSPSVLNPSLEDGGMPDRKTALVTGASSGIGLELSKLLAENGYHLFLVARRKEALERLAAQLETSHGTSAKAIAVDLTEPDAPGRIFQVLESDAVALDVLVNNAGFGSYGFFSELDTTRELQLLQVNIVALSHLTKLFLPGMVKRKSGRILNLASTASFQPGPLMATYCASKAYVLSFSEALANELKGTGVTVTALCPGATRTEFQSTAKMTDSRITRGSMMDAGAVAAIGYRAMLRGKPVVVAGRGNAVLSEMHRFFPRRMITSVARKILETAG